MEKTKNIDLLKPLFKQKRIVSQQINKLLIELDYYYGLIQLKTYSYTKKRNDLSEGYYYHIDKKLSKTLDKIKSKYQSEYDINLSKVNEQLKVKYWQLRENHEKFKLENDDELLVQKNLDKLYKEYDLEKEELIKNLNSYKKDIESEDLYNQEIEEANIKFLEALRKKAENDHKILIKTLNKILKHKDMLDELKIRIFDKNIIDEMILGHLELIDNVNDKNYLDLQNHRHYLMTANYHALMSVKYAKNIKKIKETIVIKSEELEKLDKELHTLILEDESLQDTPLIEMQENQDIHLRIDGLKMYFGGLKAVDELSFDIKRGEIFSLIGPNGAGKTTVFNCITQFYAPTAGEIYMNNRLGVTKRLNDYKVHDIITQGIARTFQNVELITELTVFENLLVGAHSTFQTNFFQHMIKSPKARMEEKILQIKAITILNRLNLNEYMYSYPQGLPYGILKRVELARALMTNPEIIILDEPAAGLNEAETKELAQLIKELNVEFNLTIFLVEHDMSLVMDISDRICVISFGKKLALGTPEEIQNDPVVQEAYLGGDRDE